MNLLSVDKHGLYCVPGDFYIDPWRPVKTAVITHAHADHARSGSELYHAHCSTLGFMKQRFPTEFQGLAHEYKESFTINGVSLSFHSAGHILGSSQVRLEYQGEVWVVAGDHKRQFDPSCAGFEDIICDVFVSEATFAMPIYRWTDPREVIKDIFAWWQENRLQNRTSVLYAYSLGKAQRLLAHLNSFNCEPIFLHPAVIKLMPIYEASGIRFPAYRSTDVLQDHDGQALLIAPPSAANGRWLKGAKDPDTAFVSGWMQLRGNRRRRGYQKGFVMSDHADWPDLIATIRATKAKKIYVTHGYNDILARFIREEMNIEAEELKTLFEGES